MPDQFDPDPRLQALLDRLTTYYPRAIDPDLHRTVRLLSDLGNPHLQMPPVIHVGGTNGKGSTLAYLRSIAESAGLSCHVMTSPHLVRVNERFVIAGQEIGTPDLIDLIEGVERINAGRETTSFELMTSAGFLAFARTKADLSLIEVGMGGRYDATNVFPNPLATIITVISRDHVKFLGNELSSIAREKAGIMKSSRPCVIGPQTAEGLSVGVMDVFEETAQSLNVPLFRHGYEWSYDILPDSFILHAQGNIYELPKPNLIGEHQSGNAATAAMAVLCLQDQLNIPLSAIENGLTHAKWPGRLQRLTKGRLVDMLPPHLELWIDGGHNDSCGMILGRQADQWAHQDSKPLHLVLGMLNTKTPHEFADYILPKTSSAQAITIPDQPLSFLASELATMLAIPEASSLEDAIQKIAGTETKPARILVTGSLYLMGYILKDNS